MPEFPSGEDHRPFDSLVEDVDEYEPLQVPAPAGDVPLDDDEHAAAIDAEILAGLVSP